MTFCDFMVQSFTRMKNFIDLKCDYNLYKTFYAVAKLGSFSAAARVLFVSQPAVSYNIKSLEKQLNLILLYRNNKTISLTPEGKKLFKFIENAHNTLVCGEKMATDSISLISGELSIGAPTHISNFYLIDLIKIFNRKFPNIKIKLYSRSTKELVEMLNDNILDLIIDNLPLSDKQENLIVKTIKDIEVCFAYNPTYISLKHDDIKATKFIMPNTYTHTRQILDSVLEKNNINFNCCYEVSTTETTLEMVLNGMGIGYFFYPSIKSYIENETLIKVNLSFPIPKIQIGYAYNKNFLSSAAQKFIELMEENK